MRFLQSFAGFMPLISKSSFNGKMGVTMKRSLWSDHGQLETFIVLPVPAPKNTRWMEISWIMRARVREKKKISLSFVAKCSRRIAIAIELICDVPSEDFVDKQVFTIPDSCSSFVVWKWKDVDVVIHLCKVMTADVLLNRIHQCSETSKASIADFYSVLLGNPRVADNGELRLIKARRALAEPWRFMNESVPLAVHWQGQTFIKMERSWVGDKMQVEKHLLTQSR